MMSPTSSKIGCQRVKNRGWGECVKRMGRKVQYVLTTRQERMACTVIEAGVGTETSAASSGQSMYFQESWWLPWGVLYEYGSQERLAMTAPCTD